MAVGLLYGPIISGPKLVLLHRKGLCDGTNARMLSCTSGILPQMARGVACAPTSSGSPAHVIGREGKVWVNPGQREGMAWTQGDQ